MDTDGMYKQKEDDISNKVLVLNQTAMRKLQEGQSVEALGMLREAEQILQSSQITTQTNMLFGVTLNNLGCLYRKEKQPLMALKMVRKALEAERKESEETSNASSTHLNLCAILSSLNRHREAARQASAALQLVKAGKASGLKDIMDLDILDQTEVVCYYNLGIELEYLGEFLKSQEIFSKGITFMKEKLREDDPLYERLKEGLMRVEGRIAGTNNNSSSSNKNSINNVKYENHHAQRNVQVTQLEERVKKLESLVEKAAGKNKTEPMNQVIKKTKIKGQSPQADIQNKRVYLSKEKRKDGDLEVHEGVLCRVSQKGNSRASPKRSKSTESSVGKCKVQVSKQGSLLLPRMIDNTNKENIKSKYQEDQEPIALLPKKSRDKVFESESSFSPINSRDRYQPEDHQENLEEEYQVRKQLRIPRKKLFQYSQKHEQNVNTEDNKQYSIPTEGNNTNTQKRNFPKIFVQPRLEQQQLLNLKEPQQQIFQYQQQRPQRIQQQYKLSDFQKEYHETTPSTCLSEQTVFSSFVRKGQFKIFFNRNNQNNSSSISNTNQNQITFNQNMSTQQQMNCENANDSRLERLPNRRSHSENIQKNNKIFCDDQSNNISNQNTKLNGILQEKTPILLVNEQSKKYNNIQSRRIRKESDKLSEEDTVQILNEQDQMNLQEEKDRNRRYQQRSQNSMDDTEEPTKISKMAWQTYNAKQS